MLTKVLARPARDADLTDVLSAAAGFQRLFENKPDAAKELIKTGDSKPDTQLDALELAAWTMVANTLMNRDDFLNKD